MLEAGLALIAVLVLSSVVGSAATPTGPTLTLTLNNTMDGTRVFVDNITTAVLFDINGNTVVNGTVPDNITAQFDLTGLSAGDYSISRQGGR
jgi:hypothetical protein